MARQAAQSAPYYQGYRDETFVLERAADRFNVG
jgi:hypothetical protein